MSASTRKLVGRAFGEVDPNDPRNAVIADIALAPRNARGMVEYSTDIYILRPVDRSREITGSSSRSTIAATVFSFGLINNADNRRQRSDDGRRCRQRISHAPGIHDRAERLGRHGGARRRPLTITVPVATNPDGSPIVGPALEEFVIDNATTMTGSLTYPAATLDKSQASLTVRVHYTDPPEVIPADGLGVRQRPDDQAAAAGNTVPAGQALRVHVSGEGSDRRRARASRPRAMSPRSCATPRPTMRRHPNPLAGDVQFVYSFCFSQPCRFMHDFLQLGFNEDEQGQRVFDGMLNWVGGASGGFFNYRFAQPGTDAPPAHRPLVSRSASFRSPTRCSSIRSPDKTDGRLRRCRSTQHVPEDLRGQLGERVLGQGRLAAAHGHARQRPAGSAERPLLPALEPAARAACSGPASASSPGIRSFPIAGPARAAGRARRVGLRGRGATSTAGCRGVRTGRWSVAAAGTSGFPHIPGVTYNGLMTTGDLFDFGPLFDQGILTILPPLSAGFPLSGLRSENGCRWQRRRRDPPAGGGGAAGDVHRLGAARRRVRRRRPL